ncbi:MAG: arylamine N-acetyltransferase [Pseudomonadota bacterium]
MRLAEYFRRIGYEGPAAPDLSTFRAVHRAHALSLTYENLDVQFKLPLTRDPAAAFDKIVRRGRGGWCYEMNGLLGSALEAIGFDVSYLAGAVMRDMMGDSVVGNHLVLLVRIDGCNWIGDVGFGDGLIDPAPLREGPTEGHPLHARLSAIGDGWWRYANDPKTGGPTFDFNPAVTDEALLEKNCRFLQSDPSSPFVQNAVAQRWKDSTHLSLRGRVVRTLTPTDDRKTLVASAEDYVGALKNIFGIELPDAARLWPQICARHEELFSGGDQ